MALKLPFTKQGVEHPDGYHKLAQRNIDDVTKTGLVVINSYHDKAARDADVIGNVLDQDQFAVTPELYDQYFTEDADHRAQAYAMIRQYQRGDEPARFSSATDV